VKLAVLLGLGLEITHAGEVLQRHHGNLRSAIGELMHDPV
jgi:N-acetylmuramic acid 6-phosphate etherase